MMVSSIECNVFVFVFLVFFPHAPLAISLPGIYNGTADKRKAQATVKQTELLVTRISSISHCVVSHSEILQAVDSAKLGKQRGRKSPLATEIFFKVFQSFFIRLPASFHQLLQEFVAHRSQHGRCLNKNRPLQHIVSPTVMRTN